MSLRHIAMAWDVPVPAVTKLVLLCLCDYAHNETGECWPAVESIATRTGLAPSTTREHLRKLEQAGYVRSEATFSATGQRSTNRYWVTISPAISTHREPVGTRRLTDKAPPPDGGRPHREPVPNRHSEPVMNQSTTANGRTGEAEPADPDAERWANSMLNAWRRTTGFDNPQTDRQYDAIRQAMAAHRHVATEVIDSAVEETVANTGNFNYFLSVLANWEANGRPQASTSRRAAKGRRSKPRPSGRYDSERVRGQAAGSHAG
jgi:hypothetical protein